MGLRVCTSNKVEATPVLLAHTPHFKPWAPNTLTLWLRTMGSLLFQHPACCVSLHRWPERHVHGAHWAVRVAHHTGGEPSPVHVHHTPGPPRLHLPTAHRLLHLRCWHRGCLAHRCVCCAIPERPSKVEWRWHRRWVRESGHRPDFSKQLLLRPESIPSADLAVRQYYQLCLSWSGSLLSLSPSHLTTTVLDIEDSQ